MATKSKVRAPKVARKRLTLIATHVAPFAAVRNPTAAITKGGVGALIAKTRKPA